MGRSSLAIVSDAAAPSIVAANNAALNNFEQSPHTVIYTGVAYITTNTIPYVFVHGSSANGLHFRSESGTRCIWRNSGAVPTEVNVLVSTPRVDAGTGFYACRKAGTGASSVYTTWANGTTVTSSSWPNDPGATSSTDMYFGRNIGTTLFHGGQYESFTVYSVAKTDAELAAMQADWAGLNPTVSQTSDDLVYARGGKIWVQNSVGQYMPVAPAIPGIDSLGLIMGEHSSVSGLGASWATDNLDASSWTAVGTPTTTTNVDSGPFSTWRAAAEGDRIVDDDAGNFEGYESVTNSGTTTEKYTVSCFLKQGDTGVTTTKARLILRQNGTTDLAICDKTLTSTWTRYTCTGTTSSPASVKGRVLVGNAASDTGSILSSQCQVNRDGWATSPLITDSSVGVDDLTTTTAEVTPWSKTIGGAHEIVFTPEFSRATDLYDAEDTYEPVDVTDPTQADHRVIMWHYQNDKPSVGTRGSGGATTTTDTYATNDFNEVAGTRYAFKIRWRPAGSGKVNHWIYFDACSGSVSTCTATTLIGSDTSGTKIMPTTDWGVMQIGCRYNNVLCLSGHIDRVRIWQRRAPQKRRRRQRQPARSA